MDVRVDKPKRGRRPGVYYTDNYLAKYIPISDAPAVAVKNSGLGVIPRQEYLLDIGSLGEQAPHQNNISLQAPQSVVSVD